MEPNRSLHLNREKTRSISKYTESRLQQATKSVNVNDRNVLYEIKRTRQNRLHVVSETHQVLKMMYFTFPACSYQI